MANELTITQNMFGPEVPALINTVGERAAWRFVDLFTVHIRNRNTRTAYGQAAGAFLRWCEGRGITRIEDIQLVHVAGYIEQLQATRKAPAAKQNLSFIFCSPTCARQSQPAYILVLQQTLSSFFHRLQ